MITTTVTNFRKNVFAMLKNTVVYNEPIHITTKEGNAVVISEDEYRSLLETLQLVSVPGMKEKLLDGMNTPLSETIPEEEVLW